jgi:hypothetical protein
MTTATATTFAAARPILQSTFAGWPAPIVVVPSDPTGDLLNELDDLIADLESVLRDRDAAACTLAALDSRVAVVSERLALVRHALERENAPRTIH